MGVLTVTVLKAENLGNKDLFSCSDPYVSVEVEQDNFVKDIDHGKQRTKTIKDQLSPEFNETFTFNIDTLDNMVVTCKVMDDDNVGKHDKMGSCKFKLEKMGLTASPQDFEAVVDRNIITASAKIFVKLSYKE